MNQINHKSTQALQSKSTGQGRNKGQDPQMQVLNGKMEEVDLNNNLPAVSGTKYRNAVVAGGRRDLDTADQTGMVVANGGPTQTLKTGRDAVAGLPNEAALVELMESSGYPITQNNGQRRYGPPPDFKGVPPCRGCEVFVGKLPRDCYEDELVPVFESVGKVYEMRLMMDYNGQNRGYAFVVYFTKLDAQRSVRTMNNYEIRKGRLLGVCQSVDNCRLFIGGIPKKVKRDEIMEEISKVTDAVTDVIVYPSATDKSKNRGFAFVEYETHRAAAMARRKLMNGKIQLWGHPIAVDWAEPEQEVDEDIMEQVKVLYVRNLQLNTTEETIEGIFKKYAEVERVKKIKDYCFIHYATREGARIALEDMQGKTIDGAEVEVTLAKPVDKEHYRQQRAVAKLMQMANQYQQYPHLSSMPPEFSAAMMQPPTFNPAGTVPAGTTGQPGSPTPGIPFMYPPPSFMPTSTMGSVGVRPVARGRGRTAAGSRSAGGRAYVLNGFLPALHPLLQATVGVANYQMPGIRGRKTVVEDQLYDILPGMDLSPTNPVTLKPQQATRTPVQMLEEICQKNNWGSPIYTLHSTVSNDGQLFLYKVTIPPLGHTYQPQKLCRNVDEAKGFAAEYTLSQLNADARVSPGSPVTTAPYQVRATLPPQAMNGARVAGDPPPGTPPYPGYVPITTQPGIMAKVTFAGGMPPQPPHGYFEFPDPQEFPPGVYQAY